MMRQQRSAIKPVNQRSRGHHPLTCLLVAALGLLLSAPASGRVDLSTPRAAAKSLWTAVERSDPDAILLTFHLESEEQRQLGAALADLLVAGRNFRDAAQKAYGDAAGTMADPMIEPADLSILDEAALEQERDNATLTVTGVSRPLMFRRSGSDWRLLII